jgi:hypothetical protein
MVLECSPRRPWGVHETVRNDAECPRCGWVAPGPVGDALAAVEASVPEGDGEALAA